MRGTNRTTRLIYFAATALLVPVVACSDDGETLGPDPSVQSTAATTSISSAAGGNGSGGSTSVSTSGSGASESGQAGFVSGTRLRARYLEGSDGAKQFIGFFDEDKQVACTFQPVYTGASYVGDQYCLPEARVNPQAGGTNTVYANASCTQLLLFFLDCPMTQVLNPMPPPYVSVRGNGCIVSEVRPVLGPATTAFYKTTGNVCTPIGPENKWQLGAPVPFSEFVKATEKIE